VGVAVNGKPVYTHGFGYRDVEKKLPVTADTIFGIGSITKSFTAVGIMQLAEQGKLSVEDPVVKYLPEFRVGKDGAEKRMTIHHFLTHTSGLPPLPTLNLALARSLQADPEIKASPGWPEIEKLKPIDTPEQVMEFIAGLEIKLLGYPGQYFSYSNDAFALLGTIIERVSGMPYESYITRNILNPLGMTRSTFSVKDLEKDPNVAMLYSSKPKKGRAKDEVFASPFWWESPAMSAAGFLKSTVSDLLKYMEIYRTGGTGNGVRILSAKSIAQMTTPYAEVVPGLHYGYGLTVHPNYHGVSLIEHGGNIKGVSAFVSCIPEKGITGACLTNLGSSPGGDLLLGAMNVILKLPTRTHRYIYPRYACPPEKLARYAGVYVSEEGLESKTTITVIKGGLDILVEGKHLKARPTGVDTFAVRIKGLESGIRFLTDTKGDTWAVALGYRIIRRVSDKVKTEDESKGKKSEIEGLKEKALTKASRKRKIAKIA